MDIVEIYHLKKYFWEGVRQIKALDGIDLAIEKGRLTAITGASGSGKQRFSIQLEDCIGLPRERSGLTGLIWGNCPRSS